MALNETIDATKGLVSGISIPREDLISKLDGLLAIITNGLEKAVFTIKNFLPDQYALLVVITFALFIGFFIGKSVINTTWSIVRATLFFGLLIFLLIAFAGGNV